MIKLPIFRSPLFAILVLALALRWIYALTLYATMGDGGSIGVDSVDYLTYTREFTVEIVNGNSEVVRTLARSRPAPSGLLQFRWNGRDDRREVVPDGFYRPRVHLAHERRTILLPNPIRMDATSPLIRLVSVRPRAFAPFGKNGFVRITYQTSERAQALLYVDGQKRLRALARLEIGRAHV